MKKTYIFPAIVTEIYDGDTIYVDLDLGFNTWLKDQRIRIDGINAPEIRTKNILEKEAGYLITEYVQRLIPVGSEVMIISKSIEKLDEEIEKGKFGRIIGDIVFGDDVELADLLLEKELAVPFTGKVARNPFSEDFLINILNNEELL